MNTLYTIGHSTHRLDHVLGLLKKHNIQVVGDVRSSPYSRHHPQYNREPFQKLLQAHRIQYVFLGKELGGRSEDPSCYVEGQVQFDLVAQTALFQEGLERVKRGMADYRIALLCAEKDPFFCHRALLVCRNLCAADREIQHILEDGSLVDHRDLERRLQMEGIEKRNFFQTTGSALPQPTHGEQEIFDALKRTFGFQSFRPFQLETVQAILNGEDAFVVMPTGGGKSLCYQLPAALMPGACIVVSPLISLMKDQVDAARVNGLQAAFLNSTQSSKDQGAVLSRLAAGTLDLLYVAPERLSLEHFFNQLQRVPLSFVAIDEAHCISEWGHDFRPDYLFLSNIKKTFSHLPVTAFTATATSRVQEDIINRLGLVRPHTVRARFDRANLFYYVAAKEKRDTQIFDFVKKHHGESGIVYCGTRKGVEAVTAMLCAQGISALPYHAGLDGSTRERNQEAFNRDDVPIIVATIAFGMGIDKSNVRFILHVDLPKNMESYYQETGRSGRDGEKAECLLLFSPGDIPKIRYFIDQMEDERERCNASTKLTQMARYAGAIACRHRMIAEYFGEDYGEEPCGACDVCLGFSEKEDAATDARTVLSAIIRTGQRFGAGHILDVVWGADTKKIHELRHHTIEMYGMGKDKSKAHWRRIIDACIAQDCIRQSDGTYPTLMVGPAAEDVMSGKQAVHVLKQNKSVVKGRKQASVAGGEEYNRDLFQKLRQVRKELAESAHVPPYVVFSDRTLHEMARYYPTTDGTMLAINGVGEKKLKQYGATFMMVIEAFCRAHPEIVVPVEAVEKAFGSLEG